MPSLAKEFVVQNILEDFSHWVEDQRIRLHHHNGLTKKKIGRIEDQLECTLPKDFHEILSEIGVQLRYSRVQLYREDRLVKFNLKSQRYRPENTLEFACYAGGGSFYFDYNNLIHKVPSVVLLSDKEYEVLWEPRCTFKAWYQLLQVYTFVEEKDYFQQEELEYWDATAKKELKYIYHQLGIYPYNKDKEYMFL